MKLGLNNITDNNSFGKFLLISNDYICCKPRAITPGDKTIHKMKSRITIEVDFDNGRPYFKIVADTESEDMRDKAIREFRHVLKYDSSWARVKFDDHHKPGQILFTIEPITPSGLEREVEMMSDTIKRMNSREDPFPSK